MDTSFYEETQQKQKDESEALINSIIAELTQAPDIQLRPPIRPNYSPLLAGGTPGSISPIPPPLKTNTKQSVAGLNPNNFLGAGEVDKYFENVQSGKHPMVGIAAPGKENLPITATRPIPPKPFFPVEGNQTQGNAMDLIKKYFPQDQWDNAYKVMMGESGGKADAKGDDYPINGKHIPSYGLFQIRALPGRPDPSQLTDPEFNVRYAADMWKKQGWQPWTAAQKLGIR